MQTVLVPIHITHPVSCANYLHSSEESRAPSLIAFIAKSWPVHLAVRPNMSLSGSGKDVLLCLASVAS